MDIEPLAQLPPGQPRGRPVSPWLRNTAGDIIHQVGCQKSRGAHPWGYAADMNTLQVDAVIRRYPWLRWCAHCRPNKPAGDTA